MIVLSIHHDYAAKFNCTILETLYKYSIDCPAPLTIVTTTTTDSGTTTDGQEPIQISGEDQFYSNHECKDSIPQYNNIMTL